MSCLFSLLRCCVPRKQKSTSNSQASSSGSLAQNLGNGELSINRVFPTELKDNTELVQIEEAVQNRLLCNHKMNELDNLLSEATPVKITRLGSVTVGLSPSIELRTPTPATERPVSVMSNEFDGFGTPPPAEKPGSVISDDYWEDSGVGSNNSTPTAVSATKNSVGNNEFNGFATEPHREPEKKKGRASTPHPNASFKNTNGEDSDGEVEC